MWRLLLPIGCASLSMVLATCGESVGPRGPRVTQLTIITHYSTRFVGESGRFVAIPYDSSSNPLPVSLVTWATSDPNVLALDDTGSFVAVARGAVTVIATAQSVTASAALNVLPRIARVIVTPAGDTLLPGATLRLSAVAQAPDGSVVGDVPFLWRSSSPEVATVDSTGVVRVLGVGPFAIDASVGSRVSGSAGFAVALLLDSLSGGAFACGLEGGGAVYCWSSLNFPLVGMGSDDVSGGRAWPVPGGVRFVTASSGVLTGCGVTGGQELYCWPFGFTYTYYQFVPGVAVLVPGPTGFTGVSVGEYHNCAVGTDELGYCWGESNSFGELGDGKNPQPSSTPSPVQGGIHFRSVTVGEWHSCGLSTSGIVYCWGLNDVSQLGIDSSATCPDAHPCSPLATAVSGGLTFKAVTAGTRHTCALTVDGATYCWGNNTSGQVGAPTTEICGDQYNSFPCATKPTRVQGSAVFVEITTGSDHSCGRTATGSVWCWGRNSDGQLGAASADTCTDQRDQPFTCSKAPIPAHAELSASEVRAGSNRTCVLANRRVYCW